MKAIHVDGEALRWSDTPAPPLRPGAVRVQVVCAGVNRADLVQRAGAYPPPPGASPTLGLEVSGVVTELGDGSPPALLGQRVCALLPGGGYAEQVVVDAGSVLPLPPSVGFAEGAAFVEVFATAWLNLAELAGLADAPPGRRVVLHAGASGVGTAAVQVLRQLGHRSFVVVGDAAKVDRCVALGADAGVVRHHEPWAAAAARWAPDGVHAVLDPVGATTLPDDLTLLAPDGAVVLIGLMGGRRVEIDLGAVLMKRLRLVGSTLRARDDGFKAHLLRRLASAIGPAWADRTVTALVHAVLPIEQAAAAHALLASNTTVGSVVLRVRGDDPG